MLSDRNAHKLNKQIEKELQTVNAFMSSEEEKSAALDRIAQLKRILDPNPTPQEIVQMLAEALQTSPTMTVQAAPSPLSDLITSFVASRRSTSQQ